MDADPSGPAVAAAAGLKSRASPVAAGPAEAPVLRREGLTPRVRTRVCDVSVRARVCVCTSVCAPARSCDCASHVCVCLRVCVRVSVCWGQVCLQAEQRCHPEDPGP